MTGVWGGSAFFPQKPPPPPPQIPFVYHCIPCHRWNSECTLPEVLAGKLRDGIKNICIYPTFRAEI